MTDWTSLVWEEGILQQVRTVSQSADFRCGYIFNTRSDSLNNTSLQRTYLLGWS